MKTVTLKACMNKYRNIIKYDRSLLSKKLTHFFQFLATKLHRADYEHNNKLECKDIYSNEWIRMESNSWYLQKINNHGLFAMKW